MFQRRARSGTTRAMRDPGLARHDWETEWAELEEDLEDSPREALSEVGDLIERMLEEQGIPIHDQVADDGIPHEVVADYVEARRITESVEKGEDVDPGDIGSAIRLYRELYDFLINRIAEYRPARARARGRAPRGLLCPGPRDAVDPLSRSRFGSGPGPRTSGRSRPHSSSTHSRPSASIASWPLLSAPPSEPRGSCSGSRMATRSP